MPSIIGFDTETDLITPGTRTPQLVCLTLAGDNESHALARTIAEDCPGSKLVEGASEWKLIVDADHAVEAFLAATEADVLVAHNMPFDVGVLANHHHDIRDTKVVNPIIAWAAVAIEQGKLADTLVAEKLITIAQGNTEFDHRFDPPKRMSYSLAHLVHVYLGIDITGDKTKLESLQSRNVPRSEWPWRYRYIDLVDVPLHQWPQQALDYALEDAVYARRVWLTQRAKDMEVIGYPVIQDGQVINEREQTAAWLALHMMSAEGAPVDEGYVALFQQDIDNMVAQYESASRALGIVRINRCSNCGDNQGGTGFIGTFPNLKVCPICQAADHDECMRLGVYKRREAQAGIGKLYTTRLAQIVRWGYHNDPPLTDRPKNQSASAYAKWTPSVKTDEETLSAINHPSVQAFIEGKKAIKLRGTYLPPLQEALADGGRLCSNPNVLVRSGRTSWTNPNLQNPPRKGRFRECFAAPEGKVMASIDYSTLELAVLSQVNLAFFGQSQMAELINAGTDLHAWFGAQLMGTSYEDFKAKLAEGDPRAKSLRQLAKIPNFGLPGGLGPKGLVRYALNYGVFLELDMPTTSPDGVTLPSARDLGRAWMTAFPEMREYFAMLSHESDLSADGRFTIKQLGSNRVRADATYTSAANTFFQGLAADGAKAAMWRLFVACYLDTSSPLFGVRMWNFIHDEFLFIGDTDTAHLWATEASRIMVEAMRAYTPDVAQAAPPALMKRWYKSADPVYNEHDVLIPWTPFDDLPHQAQANVPEGLNKTEKVLFASGYTDALAAGANHEEAMLEGLHLVKTGRIG